MASAFLFSQSSFAQSCDQNRDPHSFICADQAFTGRIFPMTEMSPSRIQGSWRFLTYSDIHGRVGPEFENLVNPRNHRIPHGVMNLFDRSLAGSLNWSAGQVSFRNWGAAGRSLHEVRGRTQFQDPFTVQVILANGADQQALQCRVFIRAGAEHLQCRWSTLSVRQNRFILRGYLGFLRGR